MSKNMIFELWYTARSFAVYTEKDGSVEEVSSRIFIWIVIRDKSDNIVLLSKININTRSSKAGGAAALREWLPTSTASGYNHGRSWRID